ncbi:MAG TPA: hypothetical protein VFA55_09730 [Candidatus Kapabacteria bacterium]|nr:hypothetical protein [Candidatus Kapabacteria bacterium]
MFRKVALIAFMLSAFFVAESSIAQVIIIAPGPPPRPRIERRIPPPSPLHIWIGGYWGWVGGRWLWTPGHWEAPPHPGWIWFPGRWKHFRDGYHWTQGGWHDRDDHGRGHNRGNNQGRNFGPHR